MALFFLCLGLYIIAISLIVLLYIHTKRREKTPENHLLAIGEVISALMLLLYLVNFFGIDTEMKRAIVMLSNSIVMVLLDMVLIVSLDYLLLIDDLFNKKAITVTRYVLWSITTIDTIIMLLNNVPALHLHAIDCSKVVFINTKPIIYGLLADGGFWLLPHFGFVYLLVTLNMVVFIKKIHSVPHVYVPRYYTLCISFTVLLVWNMYLRLAKVDYFVDLSLPIISLIVASSYKLQFDDKPWVMLLRTRRMVFNSIEDPIVLFDMNDKLVDYNTQAQKMLLEGNKHAYGMLLPSFLATRLDMQITVRKTSTVEEVTVFVPPADRRVFKLDYNVLKDRKGRFIGTLLVFNDITALNKMYRSMEQVSLSDETTGLASNIMMQRKITEINLYRKFPYAAAVCEINGLRVLHDGVGLEAANSAAKFTADLLRTYLHHEDFAAYHDGTIFLLMPTGDHSKIQKILDDLDEKLVADRTFEYPVSIEYGISMRSSAEEDIQDTISAAENEMYSKKVNNSDTIHSKLIESLKNQLANNETETKQHSVRVGKVAVCLGRRLNLSEEELKNLDLLAQFHDIGKLSIPDKLLLKTGPLTTEEKAIMSIHTIRGCQIAKNSPELKPIANCILCHHEWYNGMGYPNGYKGNDIPYLARIIAIADAFDAMTASRSYHHAITELEAISEIERCAGTQFDPVIVAAFVTMVREQYTSHQKDT